MPSISPTPETTTQPSPPSEVRPRQISGLRPDRADHPDVLPRRSVRSGASSERSLGELPLSPGAIKTSLRLESQSEFSMIVLMASVNFRRRVQPARAEHPRRAPESRAAGEPRPRRRRRDAAGPAPLANVRQNTKLGDDKLAGSLYEGWRCWTTTNFNWGAVWVSRALVSRGLAGGHGMGMTSTLENLQRPLRAGRAALHALARSRLPLLVGEPHARLRDARVRHADARADHGDHRRDRRRQDHAPAPPAANPARGVHRRADLQRPGQPRRAPALGLDGARGADRDRRELRAALRPVPGLPDRGIRLRPAHDADLRRGAEPQPSRRSRSSGCSPTSTPTRTS